MTKQGSALPLAGVRVVDFSRLLPGPWCTQVLGDLGADVVKVEQPGVGDYSRYNPPNYRTNSVYFDSVNRNKRSIVLDVAKPEDREVALRLIDEAAIVVEFLPAGRDREARHRLRHGRQAQPGADLLLAERLRRRGRARRHARPRPVDPGPDRAAQQIRRRGARHAGLPGRRLRGRDLRCDRRARRVHPPPGDRPRLPSRHADLRLAALLVEHHADQRDGAARRLQRQARNSRSGATTRATTSTRRATATR